MRFTSCISWSSSSTAGLRVSDSRAIAGESMTDHRTRSRARNGRLSIGILLPVLLGLVCPGRSAAEWYVGGQVGANFADRLTDIQGTGNLQSFSSPDFDLQNAVVYGGKLGYFPNNCSFGIELDAFNILTGPF